MRMLIHCHVYTIGFPSITVQGSPYTFPIIPFMSSPPLSLFSFLALPKAFAFVPLSSAKPWTLSPYQSLCVCVTYSVPLWTFIAITKRLWKTQPSCTFSFIWVYFSTKYWIPFWVFTFFCCFRAFSATFQEWNTGNYQNPFPFLTTIFQSMRFFSLWLNPQLFGFEIKHVIFGYKLCFWS